MDASIASENITRANRYSLCPYWVIINSSTAFALPLGLLANNSSWDDHRLGHHHGGTYLLVSESELIALPVILPLDHNDDDRGTVVSFITYADSRRQNNL